MLDNNTNKVVWIGVAVGVVAVIGVGALTLFPDAFSSMKPTISSVMTVKADAGKNLLLDTGKSFTGVGNNSFNGNFNSQGGRYDLAGGKKLSDLYNQYGSSGYLTLSFDWVASGDTLSGQFNPQWAGEPWGGLANSGAIKPSSTNKSGHYETIVPLNHGGYSTGEVTSIMFRQDNLQGNVTISHLKLEAGKKAID